MRYKIEFDAKTARWLVIDTALANQQMGVHVSKLAALQQAATEERRWLTYDPLCSGVRPLEAVASADAELPSNRAGLRLWARRPRWPAQAAGGRRTGSTVTELEGTPLPVAFAEGSR
jgi:hypothetical protein